MANSRGKRIITVVCFGVSAFLMYSLFSQIHPIIEMRKEIANLEIQKQTIEKEMFLLVEEIELLNDEDYITRYARENYVFTRDGEQVTIIPSNE